METELPSLIAFSYQSRFLPTPESGATHSPAHGREEELLGPPDLQAQTPQAFSSGEVCFGEGT